VPTAPLLLGRGQGYEGGGRGALGKMSNDAAHRGGRSSVRWRGETGAVVVRRQRTAHDGEGDPASTLYVCCVLTLITSSSSIGF
jgi:hypothetical protein